MAAAVINNGIFIMLNCPQLTRNVPSGQDQSVAELRAFELDLQTGNRYPEPTFNAYPRTETWRTRTTELSLIHI